MNFKIGDYVIVSNPYYHCKELKNCRGRIVRIIHLSGYYISGFEDFMFYSSELSLYTQNCPKYLSNSISEF